MRFLFTLALLLVQIMTNPAFGGMASQAAEANDRHLLLSPMHHSEEWTVHKLRGRIVAKNVTVGIAKTVFSDVRTEDEQSIYEIASLVGPILSVRETSAWNGGAHPGHLKRMRTKNLRNGQDDVPIGLLFSEHDVLGSLLQDSVVAAALKGSLPKTLQELVASADGGCEMSFDDLLVSYAFHHLQDGLVAIRFGLPHGCEAMRGKYTEIGIYMKIPVQSRKAFLRATAGGDLMSSHRFK